MPPIAAQAYTNEQLAALIALMLRNLDSNLKPYPNGFQDQLNFYHNLVQGLPDGHAFKDSINAINALYQVQPTVVQAAHSAIATMLTTLANKDVVGLDWGGCGFALQSQVLDLANVPTGQDA